MIMILYPPMRPIYAMNGKWAGVIIDDAIYDKEGRYRGFVVSPEMASRKAFTGEVRSPRGEYLGELFGDLGMGDYQSGKYILRNHSVAQQEYEDISPMEKQHLAEPIQQFDNITSYSKDHPSPQAYSDVVAGWFR